MTRDVYTLRLRNLKALKKRFPSQAAFAAAAGIAPAYMSQIMTLRRPVGEKTARNIEQHLQLDLGSLDTESPDIENNVTPGPPIRQQLPLISWVRAGSWADVEDPYAVGDYERLVPVSRKYSDRAYCLRVEGDSMVNTRGDGPSFPSGSIIVVEPQQQPRNGSFVVFRLEDTKRATFKKLVYDGDTVHLKPLNESYPTLTMKGDEDLIICGVVRQLVMDFD